MNITFIGNCQTASLCFYFQQLLGDDGIKWIVYGPEFQSHLEPFMDKVKNKIVDDDKIFDVIKNSDFIIYQEISKTKSHFCNTEILQLNKKDSCRLIKMPSIHLDYLNYDISLKELNNREIENNVDIMISDIFKKYKEKNLMLSICHPNTFLFLEVMDKICKLLNIDTFSEIKRNMFLEDNNYMNLPS